MRGLKIPKRKRSETYSKKMSRPRAVSMKSGSGTKNRSSSGSNPWQKKNAKYAKQDAKREKRQMRTGNK